MMRKLIKIGIHFNNKMSEKNISAYAASTAFFIFLSLVPMLMVICTMIPYTPLTEENLTRAITEVTPDQLDSMVTQLIRDVYQRASTILPLAALVMIWTAAKGLMALMGGLNAINDVQERRNYFVVRFIAAFYTVVMLIPPAGAAFFPDCESAFYFFLGGADPAVRGCVRLCAQQEAPFSGTDSGSQLHGGGVEYFFLGIFRVSELQQFFQHLRKSVPDHHRHDLDVFLHVYHSGGSLPELFFQPGEQGAAGAHGKTAGEPGRVKRRLSGCAFALRQRRNGKGAKRGLTFWEEASTIGTVTDRKAMRVHSRASFPHREGGPPAVSSPAFR